MKARSLSAVVVLSLSATLLSTPPIGSVPEAAAAVSALTDPPGTDEVPNVPAQPLPEVPLLPDGAESVDRLPTELPLPEATEVSVEPVDSWTTVAGLPVKVSLPIDTVGDPASDSVTEPAVVEVSWRTPANPGKGPVAIGVGRAEEVVPEGVDPGAPDESAPAEVRLRLQFAQLDRAFGGGWSDRMRVVAYPGCYLDPSPDGECLEGVPVETTRDESNKTMTWDASDPEMSEVAAKDSGGVVVFAVSGSTGSYAATPLPVSAGWQVGEGSGEFSYSYDFDLPAALGGQTPGLSLNYSSGSVDAMSIAENGQASPAGIGWTLSTAYISRSYAPCQDDNDPTFNNKGDLCWKSESGKPVEDLSIVLNGHASKLIPVLVDNGPTFPVQFRLEDDPGWKVERTTGSNTDNDGEAFKVTTLDGTEYWFGYGQGSDSTWTVPVYGNDTGEPCSSSCQQAWQWNLDRVVDTSGNRIEYSYDRETNYYMRFGTTRTIYDRGGVLTAIKYGFGDGTARQVVEIANGSRCASQLQPTPSGCGGNADWPDVPRDLICGSSGTCTNIGPSFFSTLRYKTVTTKTVESVNGQPVARVVDTYTLTHKLPDPDTTSGPDDPDLWLDQIQRTGAGNTPVTLPPVNFRGGDSCAPDSTSCIADHKALRNRVISPSGARAFTKYRVVGIRNEAGGFTQVDYGHESGMGCNKAYIDKGTSTTSDDLKRYASTRECFPQWYTPPGGSGGWEWFHKYVVTRVALGDDTLGYRLDPDNIPSPTTPLGTLRVYDYEYDGTPAWRYQPAPNVKDSKQTWSDWRGYQTTFIHTRKTSQNTVPTPVSDLSRRKVVVFRGMDNSRLNDNVGSTRSASLTTQTGLTKADSRWLQGRVMEDKQQQGGTETLVYHEYDTVATAEGGKYVDARIVYESLNTVTDYLQPNLVARVAKTHTTVSDGGSAGYVVAQNPDTGQNVTQHLGINAGAVLSVEQVNWDTTTKRCTDTQWTSSASTWIRNPEFVTTSGTACATSNPIPLTKTRYLYDARGLPTEVRTFKTDTLYLKTTTAYDGKGRVVDVSDNNGNTTHTDYNPGGNDNDLVTSIEVTGPTGLSTTSYLNARRGQPERVTDANAKDTYLTYDGLGRLTTVRLPGNNGSPPSMEFTYVDSTGQPSRVTSKVLRTGSYKDWTHEFYDGWGHLIESQTRQADTTNGERVFSATGYNAMGLPYFHIPEAPNGCCFESSNVTVVNANTADVSRYTVTNYDGMGRVTSVDNKSQGAVISTTSYQLGGEGQYEIPPGGGATYTGTDGWGRITEVKQYDQPAGTDPATATPVHSATYTYDDADRLTKITAPTAGATANWTYTYDLAGRRTGATDPDTGTSTTTYDDDGGPANGTDPINPTIGYDHSVTTTDGTGGSTTTEYDALGRPTKTRGAVPNGPTQLMAAWTYGGSTAANNTRGRLVSAASVTPAGTFTRGVGGYDNRGRPTSTTWTYPSSFIGESGTTQTKTTTYSSYNELDQPTSVALPAGGGLAALTLTNGYTDNGLLKTMTGTGGITIGTATYNNLNKVDNLTSTGDNTNLTRKYNRYATTGWISSITGTKTISPNPAATMLSLGYTYDLRGNPITITASGDPLHTNPDPATAKWCYAYDGLDRLKAATATTSTANCNTGGTDPGSPMGTPAATVLNGTTPDYKTYAYQGDRLTGITTNGATQPRTYTAGTHRTTAIGQGANPDTLAYDNAGRATTYTVANGTATDTIYTYTYDAAGRLTTTTPNPTTAAPTIENFYDADGLRIATRSTQGDIATSTVYLDNLEITNTRNTTTGTSTGTSAIRRFSTDTGITLGTQTISSGATQAGWVWQLADTQGSLRYQTATSSATNPGKYLAYTPYGQPLPTTTLGSGLAGDRGYLNKPHAPDGTIALDHRHYRPDLSTLTTPDPILHPYDPQSLNPYAYSRNNPISYSDPSGLCPFGMPKDMCGGNNPEGPTGYDPPTGDNGGSDDGGGDGDGEDSGDGAGRAYNDYNQNAGTPSCVGGSWNAYCAPGANSGGSGAVAGEMALAGCSWAPVVGWGCDAYDLKRSIQEDGFWSWSTAASGIGFIPLMDWVKMGKQVDNIRDAAKACSFTGSTVVLMADGTKKPIEDIEVGDKVIATDPESGERVAKTVEYVYVHQDTVTDLVVDGEVITTTEDHPFWSVTDQRFERADELDSGEKVLSANGRVITVSGLKLGTAREALAYNLAVEGTHTFHVGQRAILVHNDSTCGVPLPSQVTGKATPLTTSQAADLAKYLGYSRTNYLVKGERVFQRGGSYIVQDTTAHSGGVWKIASSVKGLSSKTTRTATTDALLNTIGR